MRKLKLALDAIQVESFTTHSGAAARGTVDGQQRQTFGCPTWTCPAPTLDTCDQATCDYSCNGGCGTGATCYSCVQTCAVSCQSCAVSCDSCVATCDATCNWTCGSCMATCNYATGPDRCCAAG